MRNRSLPFERVGFGREGSAAQVVESGLVRGHHASPRAGLDGHVADGHARFHTQTTDCRAAELNHRTRASRCPNHANGMQDDVLAAHARRELTVDLYPHVLAALGDKRLRGKHMFNFASPNAKGERTERAMCRSMAITADDCSAGEGKALLGTDYVHNALALIAEAKIGQPEFLDVVFEGEALGARVGLLDESGDVFEVCARGGGDVLVAVVRLVWIPLSCSVSKALSYMICCGEGAVGSADHAVGVAETFESLGRSDLVDEVPVFAIVSRCGGDDGIWAGVSLTDVEQDRAIVLLVHDVILQDLVVESLRLLHKRWHGGREAETADGDDLVRRAEG